MRRLFLLRHAKSAWPEGVADRDRPLARRGREAAPLIGRHMREAGYQPALALVSPATRTRETFALVDAELHIAVHDFTKAIYEASAEALVALIRAAPSSVEALMLVGHNPGMADLGLLLSNRKKSDVDAMQRLGMKYPTAGLAVFDYDAPSWDTIGAEAAVLVEFVTPRMLGGVDED